MWWGAPCGGLRHGLQADGRHDGHHTPPCPSRERQAALAECWLTWYKPGFRPPSNELRVNGSVPSPRQRLSHQNFLSTACADDYQISRSTLAMKAHASWKQRARGCFRNTCCYLLAVGQYPITTSPRPHHEGQRWANWLSQQQENHPPSKARSAGAWPSYKQPITPVQDMLCSPLPTPSHIGCMIWGMSSS